MRLVKSLDFSLLSIQVSVNKNLLACTGSHLSNKIACWGMAKGVGW